MLDLILNDGGPVGSEFCANDGQTFESMLHRYYNDMRHHQLEEAGEIEDRPECEWPEFGLTILWEDDPGVLLRAGDIRIEKPGPDFRCAVLGGRGVAYAVTSLRGGTASLWLYFAINDSKWEEGAWRLRQRVQVRGGAFICPLCGDSTVALFLGQAGEPHFGCVPCTALLDPEEKQRYEGCRK